MFSFTEYHLLVQVLFLAMLGFGRTKVNNSVCELIQRFGNSLVLSAAEVLRIFKFVLDKLWQSSATRKVKLRKVLRLAISCCPLVVLGVEGVLGLGSFSLGGRLISRRLFTFA